MGERIPSDDQSSVVALAATLPTIHQSLPPVPFTVNPDVHKSGQYVTDNHDGVYLSGGAMFARDIHYFDSMEDALDYIKWKLQKRYVEIVEVYCP